MVRWCACLVMAWAAWCAHAAAPEPIVLDSGAGTVPLEGRAQYWIEPGPHLGIDPISQRADTLPWQVLEGGQLHRLGDSALWVRFRAQMADGRSWFLVVGRAGTDRVQVFQRGPDGRFVVREAGDSQPVSRWPLPGRTPAFELSPAPGAAAETWIRIEHHRLAFAAPLRLQPLESLVAEREREQLLLGSAFGICLLLGLAALGLGISLRDRNFAALALYVAVLLLGQLAYTGLGAQYLWDDWLKWNAVSTFVLPSLSAPAALWFVQVATEPARFSRRLGITVRWLAVALVMAVIADSLLDSRLASVLSLGLTAAVVLALAVLLALAWRKAAEPGIRWIALAFVPVLLLSLFPIARGLGLVPNSVLSDFGVLIGGTLQVPMLVIALGLRAARRSEAQWRTTALPHTDVLTGLADRATLLQRLDESLQRAREQHQGCALLAVRLANHDAIASEHGRDVLDRALVVAASCLRRCAADIDLAARVGEREFTLLLEGPTTPEAAIGKAQQLVASGLRQAEALPSGLTLRLTVAVAALPGDFGNANATLHWALGALAGMPADARKQIRALNF